MPSEPPRTVFRSLARPANAEALFHRRRGPPKAADALSVHRLERGATGRRALPPRVTRRRSPELRADDAVRVDLAVERLGIDREQRGGLAAMTAHLPQDRHDVLTLDRFETAAGRRHGRRVRAEDFRRQIRGEDLVPL